MILNIKVKTPHRGLHLITERVAAEIHKSFPSDGLCTLFLQHTSASLLIQESYDDSARRDLESWLNRLVPEDDSMYTHTLEGPDDMPAHIKAMLTATQISIPFASGKLLLGTWQGIYLWEHRYSVANRNIVLHLAID
tara:strand:+ start:91 stop:501 length:411 start_codon:yes stop_codon:yes gene_type:complete